MCEGSASNFAKTGAPTISAAIWTRCCWFPIRNDVPLSGQGDVSSPTPACGDWFRMPSFAHAAAQALADHTKLSSREIAEKQLRLPAAVHR